MLRIKKLDIFIVKSFVLLFLGTFFICLFIFMMQFLWRYVDDLVGKGLEMKVLAQFFFYSALSLVPLSFPLAVLLASLITFGNFGERYELLAMKAAGIPLIKIMRPLIILNIFFCCISFYFQNIIGPYAQGKIGTLILSVRQKSPELDIPEKVFYSEIPNYNLRVSKKDRDTGMLYDVLIYNLKDGAENAHIIYADSGYLEMTSDKQHLYLHLYDGELFENLKSQNIKANNVPYRRENFSEKHTIIEFDSDFSMVDASIMSNSASTKSMSTLKASIDSMSITGDSIGKQYYEDGMRILYSNYKNLSHNDSLKIEATNLNPYNIDSIYNAATLDAKYKYICDADNRVSSMQGDYSFKSYTMESNDYQIRRHQIEWQKKITLSIACLLFFFIGAPLGGIIRKGGLGVPVILSVLIFIIYYIIDNTGYKLARDNQWIVTMGVWLSSAILAPFGAFITYKANKDSVILNTDVYFLTLKKFVGMRDVRHMFKKEVVINDTNYEHIASELPQLSETCNAYIVNHRLTKMPNYFRLWTSKDNEDSVIKDMNEHLENLIEEMSNTRSAVLLDRANSYPILSVSAHLRPFQHYWLNLMCGIIFPLGFFLYIRIYFFRIRLEKDLKKIINTNSEIVEMIINKNK